MTRLLRYLTCPYSQLLNVDCESRHFSRTDYECRKLLVASLYHIECLKQLKGQATLFVQRHILSIDYCVLNIECGN